MSKSIMKQKISVVILAVIMAFTCLGVNDVTATVASTDIKYASSTTNGHQLSAGDANNDLDIYIGLSEDGTYQYNKLIVNPDELIELEVNVITDDTTEVKYCWHGTDIDDENPPTESLLTVTANKNRGYWCSITDNYGNELIVNYEIVVENHLKLVPLDNSEITDNYSKIYVDPDSTITLAVKAIADDMGNMHVGCRTTDMITGEEKYVEDASVTEVVNHNMTYDFTARDRYGNIASIVYEVYVRNSINVKNGGQGVNYIRGALGDTVTLTASATADDTSKLTFGWNATKYISGEFITLDGETNRDSLTVTIGQDAVEYQCWVLDQYGNGDRIRYVVSAENHFEANAKNGEVWNTFFATPNEKIALEVDVTADNMEGIQYSWGSGWESNKKVVVAGKSQTYSCWVVDQYGNEEYVRFKIVVDNNLKADAVGNQKRQVNTNDTVSLSVNASCDKGALTYRWYKCTDDVDGMSGLIEKATSATYSFKANESCRYYCIVTDIYNNKSFVWFDVSCKNTASKKSFVYAKNNIHEIYASAGDTVVLETEMDTAGNHLIYEWYDWRGNEAHYFTETGNTLTLHNVRENQICCAHVQDQNGKHAYVYYDVYVTHEHSYDNGTIIKEPDCTEDGKKYYVCTKCGTSKTEVIKAAGHQMSEEVKVLMQPTCTDYGLQGKVCSVCGYSTGEMIPALGHEFSEEYTIDRAATAVMAGEKSRHCIRCDETTDKTVIPKLDSVYEDIALITEEYHEKEELTSDEKETVINAVNQILEDAKTTSQDEDNNKSIAEIVGENLDVDTINSLESLYIASNERLTDTMIRSEIEGVTQRGAVLSAEDYIPEDNNDMQYMAILSIDEASVDSMNTESNEDLRQLSEKIKDGTAYVLDIALSVADSNGDVLEEAEKIQPLVPITITIPVPENWDENYELYHYKNDGTTEIIDYIVENGNIKFVVSSLSYYAFERIEKKECSSHQWEDTIILKEVGCSEPGLEKTICSICGKESYLIKPAWGHQYDIDIKDATTTDGGKVIYTCSVCGKTYEKPFLIQFKDVTNVSSFCYKPVYWAVAKNITTGWSDGTFRPWKTCNRAAVVTFLWRMAGSPEPIKIAGFKDMPADTAANQDFRKAISWAVEQGITTGWSDNTFRPWNTCNRAAIMTFIWRYADKPTATKPSSFKDKTGTADFDAAISWASENGIANGYDDGTFGPWKDCNRASVAAFLYRYRTK